jgi:RHS repeat-associated protein
MWTTNVYDESSRVKEVILPDGAKVKTDYGVSTNGANIGSVVTITDQALKQRRSITNALGELTRVDEPDNNGNLGTIANPTQPTYYNYNGIGKMTKVSQGVQSRYFLYDSFGRLLRVRQPEQNVNNSLNTTNNPENNQWSTGFSYDDNSNILTATDAKGVVMTYVYDKLNRVKTRSYSDGTPTVSSKYDNLPFGKGRPIEVSSSVSTTKTTAFNNLGKPLNYQQITDGQTYTSTYQYDSVGTLISETYPSGRVVRNEYNSDGEISRVSGQVGTQTRTFANGFSYSASGTVERMRLGNGRWETAKFNNRLQLTEIGLGYSATNSSLWKTTLEYGVVDANGVVDVTKNSGNLAKQITSVSGMTNPIVQTYKYDSLDRILEAKETTNNQQNWSQNFGYDRYGNRTSFNQLIGQTQQTQTPMVDVNTNRFTAGQGFAYDFNGNLVQDVDGKQFIFNGDNKQTQIKDANNNVIGTYFYDGNGARIKKVTVTETTIFVYSGGKLIAEYSTQQAATPTISYLTSDHLGSPRVITDANGQVISRRDFMPFGEELNSGIGGRNTTQKYNATNDEIRQKFTGYQKDQESGLDFAEARMYKNNLGRFTAVDPMLASGKNANPQTFNRYAYTLNNPTNLVDPSGLIPGDYVNQDGDYIGWDGVKDDKIYVVTDKKEVDQIRKTEKKGGTTATSTISSELQLPSLLVRQAVGAAADRTKKPTADDIAGNHHEEAFVAGPAVEGGQETVVNAPPGAFADLSLPSTKVATSNPLGGDVSVLADVTVDVHTHPGGEFSPPDKSSIGQTTIGGTTSKTYYEPSPKDSPADFPRAGRSPFPNAMFIAASVRNDKVYIYDSSRVKATLPLDKFRTITARTH